MTLAKCRSVLIIYRRKRFKRFFEKDDEPIQMKGSMLGSEDGTTVPKTPRTPKPKVAKLPSDSDDAKPTPATGKKRKSTEAEAGDIDSNEGKLSRNVNMNLDPDSTADDTAPSAESPAKKPRASAKTPRTPKMPKSPKVPKAPRTPNTTTQSEAEATNGENDDKLNSADDVGGAETKKLQIGDPALQAKTDAAIKEAESANGGAMGEPARQAKRDAVEKGNEI